MNYIKMYESFNFSDKITEKEQRLISEYISNNELDYSINESSLFRYSLLIDRLQFFINKNQNKYILIKHDTDKDTNNPEQFVYVTYETLDSLLEDLKMYDESRLRTYWSQRLESAQVGFNQKTYINDWFEEFIDNKYLIEDYNEQYKFITYTEEKNLEIRSPYNDDERFNIKLERLYFEIHPVNTEKGKEVYLGKFLINKDAIFKEYISFDIYKRKGLRLFLESLRNL